MARKSLLVETSGGPPMVPLIDVIMLLLIFFMLVSRYLPPTLSVKLPEAAAAAPDNQPSITISIDAAGQLGVNGEQYQWEALPRLLDGQDPETRVRIAADKAADYDYIVRALDAAANARLSHIELETVQPGQ